MQREGIMNIGLVVYSKTGHTYEVVSNLNEMFKKLGHDTTIERVIPKMKVNSMLIKLN